MNHSFALKRFLSAAQSSPNAMAIIDGKVEYTYSEFETLVKKLSAKLLEDGVGKGDTVGILCKRGIESIASMFASLYIGASYVVLNPKFPKERIEYILSEADIKFLLTDNLGYKAAENYHITVKNTLKFTREDNCISFESIDSLTPIDNPFIGDGSECAYIIFTSGTTGTPKGIQVSHSNLSHFIENLIGLYDFKVSDRFAQFFEHTFDASVNDIYLSLSSGSCLYIMSDSQRFSPAKFIIKNEISIMATVPSTVSFMKQVKQLKPNSLPSLRLSFFGGEALSRSLVSDWKGAACNAQVENHYGPSECTVLVSYYSDVDIDSKSEAIPIGKILKGHNYLIVDESLGPCSKGELLICGPQVCIGYLNNTKLNDEAFKLIDGKRYYCTGDIVYENEANELVFVARKDNQIQLFGNRIELDDIVQQLKIVTNSDLCGVVPWPIISKMPQGIVAFYSNSDLENTEVLKLIKTKLPQYMWPSKVLKLDVMPLTMNGKIDTKALVELLADK